MTDDIASENDVRDEIDIEGTSARWTYALVVADPDCQGPRPSTQASERVIGVDGEVLSVELMDLLSLYMYIAGWVYTYT